MANMKLPHTLGHEIEGEVIAVGPDVKDVKVGQRFAAFPWIGCGKCPACERGEENQVLRPGAQSQRPGQQQLRGRILMPHGGCRSTTGGAETPPSPPPICVPGLTAYGALKRLVDRPRQRNLLLIGLGGVGMMGLSFAQAMFKQKIAVADLSPAARESALQNGAAVAYDPSEPDVVKRMIKETEGGSTRSSTLPATRSRWRLRCRWWRAAARSWSPA